MPTADVRAALAKVIDPELRRPITELGMVKGIEVGPDGGVHVEIYLTTSACPKKTEISERVTQAVADVPGTGAVQVSLDVMNDEQRTELRKQLRGDAREPVIPFAQPGSLTRVYAVASGKGGVGKSTVTVNLAAAMAARGLSVGVLDADIHGHSIPRMMGTTDRPTQVESMILPPIAHEVKVISIAQFTQGNTPVVWRGPMLHRALQQFLADVYWGDLDVLLLDLPPGTGDIAISVAQLIPERRDPSGDDTAAGRGRGGRTGRRIALQTRQRIVGVIENMSWLTLPDGSTMQVFGEGGGRQVAERLSRAVGADVPLLGQMPLDTALVAAGDTGMPIVLSAPDSPAGKELRSVADACQSRAAAWPACRWELTRRGARVGRQSLRWRPGRTVPGADSGACGSARWFGARFGWCGGRFGQSRRVVVEHAVEQRVVAVQQMPGDRGPRRHAPQFLQLAEGLAQVIELRAHLLAQILGRLADVVAGLTKRGGGPANRAGQPLRSEDHQPTTSRTSTSPQLMLSIYVSAVGVTVSVTFLPSRTTSIGAGTPMVS